MSQKKKPASGATDAVEYLYDRYVGDDPRKLLMLEEVRADDEIARCAYRLREQSGLSQAQLGRKLGIKASLINDLEEADYDGNALGLLRRIGAVLQHQVEVRVAGQQAKIARIRATGS